MEHFDVDVALDVADFFGGVEDVFVVCAVGVVDFDVVGCVLAVGEKGGVPICWLMLEAGIAALRRSGPYLHRRARPRAAGRIPVSKTDFGL